MADYANLKQRLETAGVGGTSAEWLLKALSPATPNGQGCQIPDMNAVSVATPEFVVSQTVSAPGAASWDCLVIKPPTYPLVAVVVAAPTGFAYDTTRWDSAGNVITIIQTENPLTAVTDTMNVSPVVSGAAVGAQSTATTLLPTTQPQRWRTAARSMTEYLVASDLNNQGTVTSGLYPARRMPMPGVVWGLVPTALAYELNMLEVPLNEANMTNMNPKVRVAPAKQGCYQPQYSAGPTFEWAQAGAVPSLMSDWNSATNGKYYFTLCPGFSATVQQLVGAGLPGATVFSDPAASTGQTTWMTTAFGSPLLASNPYTWGYDNMMTGISIYRGLSASASITLKSVVSLEIIPGPESPIRQFAKPAIAHDIRALQLYAELVADLPHSYPATANFLGAVLSAASALLPKVMPHVLSGVSSVVKSLQEKFPAEREYQPEMRESSMTVIREPRSLRASSVASTRSKRSVKVKPRKSKVKIARAPSASRRATH
jgi:hypothetical protein